MEYSEVPKAVSVQGVAPLRSNNASAMAVYHTKKGQYTAVTPLVQQQ